VYLLIHFLSVKDASPAACTVAINATATIVVNALPTGIIQTPAVNYICDGIPQILTASTADSYQWYIDKPVLTGQPVQVTRQLPRGLYRAITNKGRLRE
jgi:hypothetical protein